MFKRGSAAPAPLLHSMLCSALFCLLPPLTAQTMSPVLWALDGPAFSATPADLQAAAARVTPQPDADATVFFETDLYRLAADGRVTHIHTILYRVETREAVENWSEVSAAYDPWYQERPAIRARVLARVLEPGGRVSELDPRTLTDVPARNENDQTYADNRIRKGPLPSVGVGSIVEVETTETDRTAFFSAGGIYRNDFSRSDPVLRSRLTIEVPADVPFAVRPHRIADADVHTALASNVRRTTVDLNSPPLLINADINLATAETRYPYVEFATGASWSQVAAAYGRLAEPQIRPDTVRPLLPNPLPPGRPARIAAIVAVLHKEVRYTGVEFGEAALEPQTAADVLKRHYGDCKDKAAFLVAMLRAAGIPANLALLETGPGADVDATLAGMNQFDHAIVHVPAGTVAAAEPELWIDATAEFTRAGDQPGDLPYMDEGREALVIADGTTTLTRTPAPRPEDSQLTETRDITLPTYGPAHIVETSETSGHVDDFYRSRYGGADTKEVRKDLDAYAQNAYLAKAITSLRHGVGADLNKPFLLVLDLAKADRGGSTLVESTVYIPLADILNGLPRWFRNDPHSDAGEQTAAQQIDTGKAQQARAASYLVEPFMTTWQYRIHLPEGFVPRALPEDKTYTLGPATLTQHFAADSASAPARVVLATFHFNTGRQLYSADEVLAMRKAVLELGRQNYVRVDADQAGAALFAQGKVREAFTTDRALIAAHPQDALHHLQYAVSLLEAGLGDEARKEAKLATTLEPKLAIAWSELGQTLEHNSIGVDFGLGFDLPGALGAYRRAAELDPEKKVFLEQLAITYEYNKDGERYGTTADLAAAIRTYRRLQSLDAETGKQFEDNVLYDLLYSGKYAELLTELTPLPATPARDRLALSAIAASQSVAAALKRADSISADARGTDLHTAGRELLRLGLYTQAADLLAASASTKDNSAAVTAQQLALFRSLHHVSTEPLPATDPVSPVHLMLTSLVDGTTQSVVPQMLDRNAYATDAQWTSNLSKNDTAGYMRRISQQTQLSTPLMRDLILTNAKLTAAGDDAHGYRVTMQTIGQEPESFFVTRDDGHFRIVADQKDLTEVGTYALYLVRRSREPEARSLLDWKRDQVHRGGGDDPLDGSLFARFWSVDTPPPASAIEIAALALTLDGADSQAPLTAARAASAKTPDDEDLNLLLATAYLNHVEPASAKPYLDKLLNKCPNSITVIRLMGYFYAQTKDLKAWSALLDARLARHPDDPALLRQAALEAETAGDFPAARKAYTHIIDSGKATAPDLNALAWLGLFDNQLDDKTIATAQQAVTQSKRSFATVHTLACLYAAQGKTVEARQLLLEAMNDGISSEPNPEVWFGFAAIYEQYGANDAAIIAYRKVEAPDKAALEPTATYVLAQSRLKVLHAN